MMQFDWDAVTAVVSTEMKRQLMAMPEAERDQFVRTRSHVRQACWVSIANEVNGADDSVVTVTVLRAED